VKALKSGAFDYLTKPIQIDELLIIIEKAINHGELTTRNQFLSQEMYRKDEYCFETQSPNYQALLRNVEQIRDVDSTVLLQGETGTGKEVLAKLIHNGSPRKNGNFVPINCGALPESLLESELFGYEKGAFTDASKDQMGKLEFADGGTLFLDEVEAMSPKAQISLLRFLQEGEITRLGSNKRIQLNVRIIAATNKSLIDLCREGSFREDLYYRISVFPLDIPPLRERKEDIPILSRWLLRRMCGKLNRTPCTFSPDAEESLVSYPWPGNIRELRNCIERAVIVETSDRIQKDSLFLQPMKTLPMKFDEIGLIPLKTLERSYISWALDEMNGNKTATAEILGISQRGLYYKLER
jgi:DNA-binding NtrC family response regulator